VTIQGTDPALKDPVLKTNADIVYECYELGYISEGDAILDPTYGDGKWWTKFAGALEAQVFDFVAHDLYKLDGVDFRYLPHISNEWDVVAYDPPYCAKGGRKTSGIQEMDAAYGQDTAPATPAELQKLINDGLSECARVLRPGGYLLVKCMNYISSGKFWPGEHLTWKHAVDICGLEQVDQFIHANDGGPQPGSTKCKACDGLGYAYQCDDPEDHSVDCLNCYGYGVVPRRQLHARNNCSMLFVFRKP
jgi:hypothetical protein